MREFYNLDSSSFGVQRHLAPGISARIVVGDNAMLSVVTMEPHAEGEVHRHPEEQWGVLLDGSGVRIQDGEEVAVAAGDFWRTRGGVPHGFRAGAEGARILDIFSPPREDYRKAGVGFGAG